MTNPRPLPPSLGTSFTSADARRAGVTRGRLQAKDLSAPFRGTRGVIPKKPSSPASVPPPDEPYAAEAQKHAAHIASMKLLARVMAPGTFFSGRTMAYAYGAPIDPGELFEVTSFAPQRSPRRAGVRGRKIAPHLARVAQYRGMPVATPSATWAMLASELSVRELVIVGDS